MKRLRKGILLIMLAMFTLGMTIPVYAKTETVTLTLYPAKDKNKEEIYRYGDEGVISQAGKITGLKIKNKSVVSIKKKPGYEGKTELWLKPKKVGETMFSYKYKEAGKTKTKKVKVEVKKYVSPVTSIKLGTTTIKGTKLKNSSIYNVKYSKFAKQKVKVKITPAKDWILVLDGGPYIDAGGNSVENGSKVKVSKGFVINVPMLNKKTRQVESITIYFK